MRDDLQGGVLATAAAAPLVIVCCGGGGVVLSAITGAVGGSTFGFGGLSVLLLAAVAALTWRSLRRFRAKCCETDAAPEGQHAP